MSVQPLQDQATSLSLSPPSASPSRPFVPTQELAPTLDLHTTSKRSRESKEPSDDPRDFYGNHHRSISLNKSHDDSDSDPDQLPSFFPPLWLQRRTFICDILKREGIRSVADMGCGLGSLISLLSIPAYHLDDFPSVYPPSTPPIDSALLPSSVVPSSPHSPTRGPQSKADKLSILRSIPHPTDPSRRELHLRKLIGIDQDLKTCQKLVQEQLTSRGGKEEQEEAVHIKSRWMVPEYRWEELEIKVFNGGVESFNECLEDCEALVLTEVVEHMTEQALSKLPNLLFNIYSPRLLIITTPNHLFNPYFPLHQNPSSSSTLYPDPTCRTSRVFRDPTHLLEYTPSEFTHFCHSLLNQSNCSDEYELSFTGVGNLSSYYPSQIPFPPPSLSSHPSLLSHPILTNPIENPLEFNATQIAVFTKRFSFESERSPRSARPVPLPFYTSPTTSPETQPISLPTLSPPQPSSPHKLIGSTILPTTHQLNSSSLTSAANPAQISRELERIFLISRGGRRGTLDSSWNENESNQKMKMDLGEIWRIGGLPTLTSNDSGEGEECLRVLCRGEIGRVVETLVGDEGWRFELAKEERGSQREGIDSLVIEWIGGREGDLREFEEGFAEEVGPGEMGLENEGDWQVERREASQVQEEMEERERQGVERSRGEGNPDQGGWNDEW